MKQAGGFFALPIHLSVYNEDWQTVWARVCDNGIPKSCADYEIVSGDTTVVQGSDTYIGVVSYTKAGLGLNTETDPSFDGVGFEINNPDVTPPYYRFFAHGQLFTDTLSEGGSTSQVLKNRKVRLQRASDTDYKNMTLTLEHVPQPQ